MEELNRYFWISDEEFDWIPAKIVGIEGNSYKVELKLNEIIQHRFIEKDQEITEIHPSCLKGVDDLLSLGDFNKQTLLHNTRERFSTDEIYSFIGTPILIAVNPYKSLPIYDEKHMNSYKDYFARLKADPNCEAPSPHLYHIAEAAYQDMLNDKVNQSIIISGESGSGKTESTKIILKYLAMSSILGNKQSETSYISVEKQVLDSNPILEAFGNAKTVRNNNSSRFGKFIQVNFTEAGSIISAKIYNYLLEKSRIVKLQKEERNYHIFYQLLRGADDAEKKKHMILHPPEYFNYLNQSDCYEVEDEDDRINFSLTKECLIKLNFKTVEITYIFNILMGILYLGNINFTDVFRNGVTCAEVEVDEYNFKNAAFLLGLQPEALKSIMTVKKMKDVLTGSFIEKDYSIELAYQTRDGIAKMIYSKMFNWLVRRINDAISNKDTENKNIKKRSIGLLDIFGFENFTVNSFEQLCINYANERLQQYFNNHIFKLEQEEYKKEKIDWSSIEFIDNLEIVKLIDDSKISIFSLLDSEGLMRACTDYTFRSKVYSSLYEQNEYLGDIDNGYILIHHYAGDVCYDVEGFIDKNTDMISSDIQEAMEKSKNKLISKLFVNTNPNEKTTGRLQSDTLSKQFKKQLDELLKLLSQSNPRYVKCIKPNPIKKPKIFDSFEVGDQLLSAGVLEAIKIRRQGYSIRRTLKDFCLRYHPICPSINIFTKEYLGPKGTKLEPEQEMSAYRKICLDMLKVFSEIGGLKEFIDYDNLINPPNENSLTTKNSTSLKYVQVGVTKIFLKDEFKNALESKLNRMKYILKIQTSLRKYFVYKKLKLMKKKVAKISKLFRGYAYRKKFKVLKCCHIIQRNFRHFLQKKIINNKLKRLVIEAKKAKLKSNRSILITEKEGNNNLNTPKNFNNLNNTAITNMTSNNFSNTSKAEINKLIEELNSDQTKKRVKKQSIINDLALNTDIVQSELCMAITVLKEENKRLQEEKETTLILNKKMKESSDAKTKQIEILEEKLKHMKSVVMQCEDEMKEIQARNKIKIPKDGEDEVQRLKEENINLKRSLNELKSNVEILEIKVEELTNTCTESNSMVDTLKSQYNKRREKDEKEINELLENVSLLKKEKLDLENKLKDFTQSASYLSNYNSNVNLDINSIRDPEFLKQTSKLKNENKTINRKFDEYKLNSEIEISKLKSESTQKDVKLSELLHEMQKIEENLMNYEKENKELTERNLKLREVCSELQMRVAKLEKENENNENIKYKELENSLKMKENEIFEQLNKIDDLTSSIERKEKLESALRVELKAKETEIRKRNEIIKELQEEIDKNNDDVLNFKKENMKIRNQVNETTCKYESMIKSKNQEIFILKENNLKNEKYIQEMKEIINKKRSLIENKKKINKFLIDIVKIKKGEVQCLEVLKLTDSTNLKEKLQSLRENEQILIKKIDEINQSYLSDDSEDYEDEDQDSIEGFNSSKSSKGDI